MIVKTFTALDKTRAIRKALSYWYGHFKSDCTMIEFFNRCTWKKEGKNFFIIYRGAAPKDK